jgi:hypothetical protein
LQSSKNGKHSLERNQKNKQDFWIWGGDNAYSNTGEMNKLKMDSETLINKRDISS